MNNHSLFKMLLGSFLLVLLLATQVLTTPVIGDTDLVSIHTHTLSARGPFKDLFRRKAKKGDCDDSCDLHEPQGAQQPPPPVIETPSQAQTHLEQLWNTIIGKDLANVGNIQVKRLDVQTPAIYGATEIYGCTVVIVLDVGGLAIGHYPEEVGNTITLDSVAATKKHITDPLFNDLSVYTSGLSTVGSRGKVVVTWEPLDEGGAELQLYIQNDNPVYVRQFDQDGNPCALIR
ncbi:hypothetical protein BDW59DRAFT_177061 [Aspergillus cavernicola]|uniref:Uncharacterized protein n=1 Tax=Aspergillus cavernicola TaxID=176166 RepID=A0ABR4H8Q0_9EURO